MAISLLGTETFQGSDSPHACSVTIPSGTTLIVVFDLVYSAGDNHMTAANLNGSQAFTIDVNSGTINTQATVAHLFNPASTGSQTVNITVTGNEYGHAYLFAYYSGVDESFRDTDASAGASLTLTTQSGDVVVVGGGGDADLSWSNASERDNEDMGYGLYTGVAECTADGTSETVSFSGSSIPAIAALVLVAAGGGGKATKNTRSFPLGVAVGMHKGMGGWH